MKRNALRIVCNSGADQISYYFRNEIGEWVVLSGSSPLSRQFYTRTTMRERSEEIVKKIDEVYNRKNKGLDIIFEGTSQNYDYLAGAVGYYLKGRDIVCSQKTTKIAVVGKKRVGKSCLIEGIGELQGCEYKKIERAAYTAYLDEKNHICWYEIKGIDLGESNVDAAFSAIKDLSFCDLATVIYCVSSSTGRIEEIEKEFITRLKVAFPSINVLTAITMCYQNDVRMFSDEIEKVMEHIEVFPTLAKEYKVGAKGAKPVVVEPFGLEALYTYVFEGKKVPRQYKAKESAQNKTETKTHIKKKRDNVGMINTPWKKGATGLRSSESVFVPKQAVPNPSAGSALIKKKIAVVGKKNAGKSTLIEGLEKLKGIKLTKSQADGDYCLYEDNRNCMQWYEVKGIDLGKDKVKESYLIIKRLISQGITSIAYCISAGSGRIEGLEKDLIKKLVDEFPDVQVTIVLTMCIAENMEEIINDVKEISNQVKIVQTLAKKYTTGAKKPSTGMNFVIEPFGLDEVFNLWGK